MRKAYIHGGSLIAIAAATLLGQSAFAQTAAPPPKDTSSQGLQEVVVVARRINERLQNVPLTVTAVSQQKLKETQVSQGTDLIKLIPTLSVQQYATEPTPNYAVRGIRDGVVTYFNEVPTDTAVVDQQIWDLSSVQALAGPQGTLFGKNSTGGTILFVPQRPTDKFGGYIDASYGSYNFAQLTAVVNLPVNDMLQLRFGYRLIRHDGFVQNTLGPAQQSENRNAFRVSALFTPTPKISNYTVFDYGTADEQPVALISSFASSSAGCFALAPPPNPATCFYGNTLLPQEQAQQNAFGIRKVADPFPSTAKQTGYGVSNIFSYSVTPNLTFKYIFGYRYSSFDNQSSKDGFTVPIEIGLDQENGATQFTNEVQLLGKVFDNRLTWQVGYFNNQMTTPFVSSYEFVGGYNLVSGISQPFNLNTNITAIDTEKFGTQAEYGQATFAITPKLNFTAGVRYTSDTESSFGTSETPPGSFSAFLTNPFNLFFPPPPPTTDVCGLSAGSPGVDLGNCTQRQSLTTSALTYNISLDYHLSPGAVFYFTTRKGYNAGGFNPGIPASAAPGSPGATYKPEYVTDYEIGAKLEGSIAGRPYRANLSTYFANYTDIQRIQFGYSPNPSDPTGPPEAYQAYGNGPAAEIYGFQLESVFKPTRYLTLSLNYGFLRTLYTKGSAGFPKGNSFGQAPEHSINFSATYRHPVPAGGDFLLTADWAFQSKISFMDNQSFSVPTGTPGVTVELPLAHPFQAQYGIADLQVGWESVLNSPVDVVFFVKNLTNTAYAIERQDQTFLLGFTGTVYNDPRTFGVSLHYHFGQ